MKVSEIKGENQWFNLRFLSFLFLLSVTAISKWNKYKDFYVCLICEKFRLLGGENLNLRKFQWHQKPQSKGRSKWFGWTWIKKVGNQWFYLRFISLTAIPKSKKYKNFYVCLICDKFRL